MGQMGWGLPGRGGGPVRPGRALGGRPLYLCALGGPGRPLCALYLCALGARPWAGGWAAPLGAAPGRGAGRPWATRAHQGADSGIPHIRPRYDESWHRG